MFLNESIIPYSCTDSIKLYQTIAEVKRTMASECVEYEEEVWNSRSETIPNPWTVITVEDVMSLFFAKNSKLFKIVFWQNYAGSLSNGIRTGMTIAEAKKLDASLEYNDWHEDYESATGYWLEDDVETGRIISISIFIKELMDEEHFDHCDW